MLGDLVYEGTGRITGQRVLDARNLKVETSFTETGKLRGVAVTDTATYWSLMRHSGNALFGDGKGILIAKERGDVITWTARGIGRFVGGGKISWRGGIFFETSSKMTELQSIDDMAGAFEYEIDEAGNTVAKVWEWK